MHPQPRRIYVIMVHYGDPAVTYRSLAALQQGHRQPDRIVVIDNSNDGFTTPTSQDRVLIVRPAGNTGYGGGLTVGLGVLFAHKIDESDIVVCMNNDLRVAPTTLTHIEQWFVEHPQPALAGYRLGRVNPLTGRARLIDDAGRAATATDTLAYVHGAFLVAPWSVYLALKVIPDQYFMYWEDVLISWQARRLMIPLRIIPDLALDHDDSLPTTMSDQQQYYLIRNGALCLEQEAPWLLRRWWWFYNRARYGYHRLRQHPIASEALGDALKGKTGPRQHSILDS